MQQSVPFSENRTMPATLKEEVIDLIRKLPDDATLTDIVEELYVRQKIEKGIAQLDAGESLSTDEVKQRLGRWLK
jgi:translation initiation factor RLI1